MFLFFNKNPSHSKLRGITHFEQSKQQKVNKMEPSLVITMPPYAVHMKEAASREIVSGLRLNTVMPVAEPLEDVLKRMQDNSAGKELWVDLKCRQIRTTGFGVPPFTSIEISHNIKVNLPAKAYFGDREPVTLVRIDGRKLIFLEGPQRVVGPGESVNIPCPSLRIEGFFTDTDKRYIDAAEKVGIKRYMLSYAEGIEDVTKLRELVPDAEIREKIESRRGLRYVAEQTVKGRKLMAACGDLFIEVNAPHEIAPAMDTIIRADPTAIAASRHFPSMEHSPRPTYQDIMSVYGLLHMGYRTFMLGDELCLRREPVMASCNLFSCIVESYNGSNARLIKHVA